MNNFAKDFALAEQEINELNETIAKMQIVIDEQQKMINKSKNRTTTVNVALDNSTMSLMIEVLDSITKSIDNVAKGMICTDCHGVMAQYQLRLISESIRDYTKETIKDVVDMDNVVQKSKTTGLSVIQEWMKAHDERIKNATTPASNIPNIPNGDDIDWRNKHTDSK